MTEQLISKETAVLAKEKGFDLNNHLKNGNPPTQSLLQKWLREKHNIDISILGTSGFYYIGIHKKDFHNLLKYFHPNFKLYEEALEFIREWV